MRWVLATLRWAAVAVSGGLGVALVLGLVLGMNALERGGDDAEGGDPVAFEVAPQKKKAPPKRKRKAAKRKKRTSAKPPPIPLLGQGLSGFAIDLPDVTEGLLSAANASIVGDARDVVMDESTVDALPVPRRQVPPKVPSRAAAKGITGQVTLSFQVGADGRVSAPRVVSVEPAEARIYEEPSLIAIRQWAFEPATYAGRPVSMRATYTLEFGR